MRCLIVGLAAAAALLAQDPAATEWRLQAPAPAPVRVVSASLVGAPGGRTLCYYVVANYVRGSRISEPGCITNAPSTLSVTNYVRVSWSAAAGALSYDVLRSSADAGAGTCTACAVITATTALTVNDTGGALVAYTYNAAPSAAAALRVENRDLATPRIVSSIPINVDPAGLGSLLCVDTSLVANTIQCANSAVTAYEANLYLILRVANANSGPVTVNVNGLGAKALLKVGSAPLIAGDLSPGDYPAIYDGTQFRIVGGTGGGGTLEVAYEADIVGTSIVIAAATHGKGLWPDMRVYTGGSLIPLQYAVNGSGDISATGLVNGTYHVKIFSGGSNSYEADFVGVTSISVLAATHGKGLYPSVVLFSGGSQIPCMPAIDGSGNITIAGLVSGDYHLKVY